MAYRPETGVGALHRKEASAGRRQIKESEHRVDYIVLTMAIVRFPILVLLRVFDPPGLSFSSISQPRRYGKYNGKVR